jgi:hypothetical protein
MEKEFYSKKQALLYECEMFKKDDPVHVVNAKLKWMKWKSAMSVFIKVVSMLNVTIGSLMYLLK